MYCAGGIYTNEELTVMSTLLKSTDIQMDSILNICIFYGKGIKSYETRMVPLIVVIQKTVRQTSLLFQ